MIREPQYVYVCNQTSVLSDSIRIFGCKKFLRLYAVKTFPYVLSSCVYFSSNSLSYVQSPDDFLVYSPAFLSSSVPLPHPSSSCFQIFYLISSCFFQIFYFAFTLLNYPSAVILPPVHHDHCYHFYKKKSFTVSSSSFLFLSFFLPLLLLLPPFNLNPFLLPRLHSAVS